MLNVKNILYFVVITGLGLGMGLSLALVFTPEKINAQQISHQISSYGVQIERIRSTKLGIDTLVTRGEMNYLPVFQLEAPAIHLIDSANLGQDDLIVIQGIDADYSLHHLDQARLGDEIFVIGSNGGWYRFIVNGFEKVSLHELKNQSSDKQTLVLFLLEPFSRKVIKLTAYLKGV